MKTTKCTQVWETLIEEGITKFKCATSREAILLGRLLKQRKVEGADILVAYPAVGPNLKRLGMIAAEIAPVPLSVLAESVECVHDIPENLDVYIDINPVSFAWDPCECFFFHVLFVAAGNGPIWDATG